jgi:subfamily B ATP-binding cassette protein MsbA
MRKSDLQSIVFLLRRFALRYWPVSLTLLFVSLLAGLAGAVQPLVLAPAIQILAPSSPPAAARWADLSLNNLGPSLLHALGMSDAGRLSLIVLVSVLYVLFALLVAVLNYLAYLSAMWVRTTLSRDMNVDLQRHVLALPLAFFHEHRAGDLISRFTRDADGTAYFLDSVTRGILQSLVTAAICLGFLFRTDARLAGATLLIGSLHVLITRLLNRHVRQNMTRQQTAFGLLSAVLQESFMGIRTIKSFGAEAFESGRFRAACETVRRKSMQYVFYKHLEEPLRLLANAIAIAAVLVLSFLSYEQGRLSMAGFAMFLVLAQRVIEPISQLMTHALAISGMLGSAARVLELFQTENTLPDGGRARRPFSSCIRLEGVDFEYRPGAPVLRRIDLAFEKGRMTAIVGPSGSGKSTLMDLVLRLCDPTTGVVSMDGVDIREFVQSDYRRQFGVVPQECFLLHASVRDNIVYGRAEDPDRLARAMALACADDFIRDLPQGLDTVVGDRGVRLSGGQRQRIAIARAIYDEPAILVLDEATSSLDTHSERQVQRAIDRVTRDMTAIVIAHRLSTVLHADRIVVLKDGTVEAVGRHDELMDLSPTYGQLSRWQFRDPAEETISTNEAGIDIRKGEHDVDAG